MTVDRIHLFGDLTLDLARGCLLRGREQVHLRPQSYEVLRFLAENKGRLITKDKLIEEVWHGRSVTDNSLSKCIEEVRDALGLDARQYLKNVRGRGYIFEPEFGPNDWVEGEAFWTEQIDLLKVVVEDVDSSGQVQRTTPPVSQSTTMSRRPASPVLSRLRSPGTLLLLAACAVGAIAVAIVYFRNPSEPAAPITSIVVLPFTNEGTDPDTEYISDGLSESLINDLSRLTQLKVISRSSAFKYKGKDADPNQVATALNVQAIVIGRVVQRGDNLVVSAELVDTRDGTQVWGERYERKVADLISVQREITREIVNNLRLKLSGAERSRAAKSYTENPEAHRLYLKGRFFWNRRTAEALNQAVECFKQAVVTDANYALAHAGLADAYALLPTYQSISPKEAMPKAKAAAERAISLDETLAEPHATLGLVKIAYEWDWAGGGRELERAVELNPNYVTARQWYASPYLAYQGRFDEALGQIRQAQERDPLALILSSHEGWIYYQARQYDQAVAAYQKTLELDPDFGSALTGLGMSYEQKGMFEEATTQFRKAARLAPPPHNILYLGHAYAISGRRGKALKILDQMKEQAKRGYVDHYLLAVLQVGLAEKEQALDSLQKAYEDRSALLTRLKIDPRLDPLRSDPRFGELIRRIRLPP